MSSNINCIKTYNQAIIIRSSSDSEWDFTHTLGSDLSGHNPNETWIMTLREMTSMSRLIICQIYSATSQPSKVFLRL